MTKQCGTCKEVKPLSEFKLQRGRPRHQCKECKNKESREYYLNNKEKKAAWSKAYSKIKKDADLKKMYGISLDEYNRKRTEQNCSCAICGVVETQLKRALAVDHCHKTGKVRGLLCDNCNRAIGLMKDDALIVKKASEYLNAHST